MRRQCAVCERSLLLGEHTTRFSPDGREYHDVCVLCGDTALDSGWAREGHGLAAVALGNGRRRRRRTLWQSLLGTHDGVNDPVVSVPHLRRLSDDELVLVEAADLFNQSLFSRTIQGVARSLGDPHVSIVPIPGPNGEAALTVVWEITWYRYRISPESSQPVRVDGRGDDVSDLEAAFTNWNARLDETGRIVLALAPAAA